MLETEILERLRARGHRLTPQRAAIVREFLSRGDHPTAEAVHEAIAREHPMVALSTVYDTLRLLVELGHAGEVTPGSSAARFDPNTGDHCHLVCRRCGAIEDLAPGVDLGEVARSLGPEERRFQVDRVVLNVVGVCEACAAGE